MLFIKELKKIVFSIPFIILLAGFFLMVYSQGVLPFNRSDIIEEPKPGQENYGTKISDDSKIIMPEAMNFLYLEFLSNRYAAYPVGFYKSITLSEDEQFTMAEILAMLSGEDAQKIYDGYRNAPVLTLKADIAFSDFQSLMQKADDLIGGGSSYDRSGLASFGRVLMDYEDAKESFEAIKDKDHFTGAYARLFNDYAVIIFSILPVFLGVSMRLKDKKNISQLIYTRKISSIKLIVTRFLAIITAVFIPAVIIAYISNVSVWGFYPGEVLDYLAPLKYCAGWILPSIMISTAVGLFFTELTSTPVAVAIQGLWWFIDLNAGIRLVGKYPLFLLTPRHNTLYQTEEYLANYSSLVANRLFFAAASIILVLLTVIIYELKRKGSMGGHDWIGKLFKKPFKFMADH